MKYLYRYDIYRTDRQGGDGGLPEKGLNGMYTRYEYWKLLQLLKDSQEKEAVAQGIRGIAKHEGPWVLAGTRWPSCTWKG